MRSFLLVTFFFLWACTTLGCGGRGWIQATETENETNSCGDTCTSNDDKALRLLVWLEDEGDQSVAFPLNDNGLIESTFAAAPSKLRFFADNGEITVKSIKIKYTGDRLADISSVWLYNSFNEMSVYYAPSSIVNGIYVFQSELAVPQENSNFLEILVYFLAPPGSVGNRHSFEIENERDVAVKSGLVEGDFPLNTPDLILAKEE